MKKSSSTKSGLILIIILGVVIFGSLTMVGGLIPQEKIPVPIYPADGELKDVASSQKGNNLQLKSLSNSAQPITPKAGATSKPLPTSKTLPTSKPLPTVKPTVHYCSYLMTEGCVCKASHMFICEGGKCVKLLKGTPGTKIPKNNNCELQYLTHESKAFIDNMCQTGPTGKRVARIDGTYCIAKPVIYLYPEKPTYVNVSVETEGKIVVSDPLYPKGGWKNVLAHPSGKLIYENKEYRDLFYESETSELNAPKDGIIVKRDEIEKELNKLNKTLGLTDFESNELNEFWVPILKNLPEPYILVSLIQGEEKDRIDKIYIDPKPRTFIEILYYFKPLDKIIDVGTLKIPPTPKRVGFTAVEWGGAIDHEK